MAGSAVVRVAIVADNSKLNSGLKASQGKLKSFGKTVAKAGLLAGAAAGVGLAKFGASAVQAASDAQQSLGATETVFGRFADKVVKDSNRAATQFGLSANEYRTNANLIGSLLKNQGVSLDQLGGKTKDLIGISSDLAATFGGTTADAVGALGAALKGEFDQLERYGVSLKQSTVNTEAFRVAGVKSQKAFDELSTSTQTAAKRQATTNLIMKQSKDSVGAFARESDTLAHQQQVLAARFENVKTKIGSALLPVVTNIVGYLNSTGIPAFRKLWEKAKDIAGVVWDKLETAAGYLKSLADEGGPAATAIKNIKNFLDKLDPSKLADIDFSNIDGAALGKALGEAVVSALQTLASLAGTITQVFKDLFGKVDWVSLGIEMGKQVPAMLVGLAVGILAFDPMPILKGLADNWQVVLAAVLTLAFAPARFAGILGKLLGKIPFVGKFLSAAVKWINQLGGKMLSFGGDILKSFFRGLTGGKFPGGALLSKVLGMFKSIPGKIGDFFTTLGTRIGVWALDAAENMGTGIRNAVPQVLSFVASIPGKIIRAIGNLAQLLFPKGTAAIQGMWNGLKGKVGAVLGWFRALPGRLLSALGNVASLLYNIGKNLIQGLINGISSMFGAVQGKLGELTSKLTSWKGPPAKDKKLLYGSGLLIMEGLADGLRDGSKMVQGVLEKTTDQMGKKKPKLNTLKVSMKDALAGLFDGLAVDVGPFESEAISDIEEVMSRITTRFDNAAKQARKRIGIEFDDKRKGKTDKQKKALDKEEAAAIKRSDQRYKNQAKALKNATKGIQADMRETARAIDQVNAKIEEQAAELESLRSEAAAYAEGIKESFVSLGDVTQLGKLEDGTVSIQQLIADMGNAVTAAKNFAANIAALKAAGLNDTAIQQMLAAGPAAAGATAAAIAAGGAQAVTDINAMQAELAAVGEGLGTAMSDAFFGADINLAQGALDSLVLGPDGLADLTIKAQKLASDMAGVLGDKTYKENKTAGKKAADGLYDGLTNGDKLTKAGQDAAEALVKAFKDKLGIKSPSRVFQALGDNVSKGLVIGVDNTYAKSAGKGLASALVAGFGTPGLSASAADRPGTQSVEVRLTAQQVSELERGRSIQLSLDAYRAAGGRVAAR